MKVIIPIAGKGTRMRPLTHTVPKPLIPIANKPAIQHILNTILKTEGVEVSEVIFITGHLSEDFAYWAKKSIQLPLTFIEQKVQNGTADAVRLAEDAVGGEDVLIVFSTGLFDADLEVIAERQDLDGIIWCAQVQNPSAFGVVAHDEEKIMTELIEKPQDPPSDLVNIGMYYIRDSESMFAMIGALYEHEIRAKGDYSVTEAFDLMAKNGKRILVEPVEGWYPFGTLASTLAVNREFCQRQGEENSIHDTALVENSTLFNCIVMRNARIENCDLSNSIIGPGAHIKHYKGTLFVGSDAEIHGTQNLDVVEEDDDDDVQLVS